MNIHVISGIITVQVDWCFRKGNNFHARIKGYDKAGDTINFRQYPNLKLEFWDEYRKEIKKSFNLESGLSYVNDDVDILLPADEIPFGRGYVSFKLSDSLELMAGRSLNGDFYQNSFVGYDDSVRTAGERLEVTVFGNLSGVDNTDTVIELERAVSQLNEDKYVLQVDNSHKADVIAEQQSSIQLLEQQTIDFANTIGEKQQEIEQLQEDVNTATSQVAILNQQVSNLNNQITDLQQQLSDSEFDVEEYTEELTGIIYQPTGDFDINQFAQALSQNIYNPNVNQ